RVIRNEFPYLGRLGPAAWANVRLVGGDHFVGFAGSFRRFCPDTRPGPRRSSSPQGRPKGRSQGGAEGSPGTRGPAGPAAGSRPAGRPGARRPAAGAADPADLRTLDEV